MEISQDIKRILKKRWSNILTRYTKLEKNNWIRQYKKGCTIITVDCSKTKDFYLKEIEKAKKILETIDA